MEYGITLNNSWLLHVIVGLHVWQLRKSGAATLAGLRSTQGPADSTVLIVSNKLEAVSNATLAAASYHYACLSLDPDCLMCLDAAQSLC
jgi:hypothetical protein